MRIDPTNTEQAKAWGGREGDFWASHPQQFDRAVAAYHGRLLASARIAGTDQVLDIGCGTGQVTRDAARLAAHGSALGIDISARMLEVAHRLAVEQGVGNACFVQADAQVYPFPAGSFDVAISRAGTMFFGDPAAAFANIGRALRPGGRLAMMVWQDAEENEWIIEFATALAAGRPVVPPPADSPGPFALADPGRLRTLLGSAGFSDVQLSDSHEAMWFGADADGAQGFALGLLGWMLDGLDASRRARALDALRTTVTAHQTNDGVTYRSGVWMVTARRDFSSEDTVTKKRTPSR